MRVTADDGVELEVRAAGAGPGLVLVHGFGGAKEDFEDHVEALAADHRVVTFDHRGHGESDGPDDPGAYSLDRLAADTGQVADAVGLERFRLLGHSMGGMVARRLVLADPTPVEALVLMNTSSGPIPSVDPALVDLGAEIARTEGMARLKEVQDEVDDPLSTPAYERLLAHRPGYAEYQERKWAALSPVMWATLAREIANQPEELASLARITMPVLVIVGEEDAAFGECCDRIAGALAHSEYVVIPDAGHSPQFEAPEAWFRALDGFLRELPVGTVSRQA